MRTGFCCCIATKPSTQRVPILSHSSQRTGTFSVLFYSSGPPSFGNIIRTFFNRSAHLLRRAVAVSFDGHAGRNRYHRAGALRRDYQRAFQARSSRSTFSSSRCRRSGKGFCFISIFLVLRQKSRSAIPETSKIESSDPIDLKNRVQRSTPASRSRAS